MIVSVLKDLEHCVGLADQGKMYIIRIVFWDRLV